MFKVPDSIIPLNETERMDAVRRYDILDTPPDGSFDRVTALAARRFQVPIAIISVVDHDRIWFKSHHGLAVQQIGRDPGLCASAILQATPYVIADASKDVRSLANPLVAGDFGLRFYAAAPLTTHDGFNLGTLCVIDQQPRTVTQDQMDDLADLAGLVTDQLELRLSAKRSVEQTALLGREIEHRVMNNLQFVSSMLRLQGKAAAGADPVGELEKAANRVTAVARVQRHFNPPEVTDAVPAVAYLDRLCRDLSDLLGVTIDVGGDEGSLGARTVQPIGLMVNELVTNAAKHGAGKITVRFKNREMRTVTVCDQGSGLPGDFDLAKPGRGLGMKIIKSSPPNSTAHSPPIRTQVRQGPVSRSPSR